MLCTRIVKLLKSLYLLHFKLSLQTESEHANAKSALTKSEEKMAKLYLYANFTFVAFSAFAQCDFAGNPEDSRIFKFSFLLVANDSFRQK